MDHGATSLPCWGNWPPPWVPEPLTAAEFLAWLQHGAAQVLLPGLGVQEAGIQVLGLLEMRGLDFSGSFAWG